MPKLFLIESELSVPFILLCFTIFFGREHVYCNIVKCTFSIIDCWADCTVEISFTLLHLLDYTHCVIVARTDNETCDDMAQFCFFICYISFRQKYRKRIIENLISINPNNWPF